jgi:hypothetical protein
VGMTCETPIDLGDSRSYSITVLLGSHRFKGREEAGLSVEGGLGFFMFAPTNKSNPWGTTTVARMARKRKDALCGSPRFAGKSVSSALSRKERGFLGRETGLQRCQWLASRLCQ